MSSGQNVNGYNGDGMQTSFISPEHDKDPPVVVYSLIQNLLHPNILSGDDKIRQKEFTEL